VRRLVVALMVLGAGLAGAAYAGGKKEERQAKRATGALISATLEGGMIKWKIALDGEGEKVFQMAPQVSVMYTEKNGNKIARAVRPQTARAAEAKGNALIAQGEFVKAELQGNKVLMTIKAGEGEKATQEVYGLPSRLIVAYQDGEPLTALAIHAQGGGKDKPEKGDRGGKRNKEGDNKPPENL